MAHTFKLAALFLLSMLLALSGFAEEINQCAPTAKARPVLLQGGWVLLRSDGKVASVPGLSHPLDHEIAYSDGLYGFAKRDFGALYLDDNGNVVLDLHSVEDAKPFSEGLAARKENGFWGYMDQTGRFVINPTFIEANMFSEGLAAVQTATGWCYIDKTGRIAIAPEVPGTDSYFGDFHSGRALVIYSNGTKRFGGYIDSSGQWAIRPSKVWPRQFHNGLALDGTDLLGFVDPNGALVIPRKFKWAALLAFEEDLAAVAIEANGVDKVGFIDREGRWAIPPRFDNARHFCYGLAPVAIGENWGYIDKNGTLVIAPQFADAQSFEGGIASVLLRRGDKLWQAYINHSGTVVLDPILEVKMIELH